MNTDPDLQQRFAALREEEAARIAGFEHVLQHRRPRPVMGPRALAVAACLMAAITVTLVSLRDGHPPTARGTTAPLLADWRAPTDFLLHTSGTELLHSMPRIGGFSSQPSPAPRLDRTPSSPTGQEPHS